MENRVWHDNESETYEGTFLGDSFHGQGTYKWKNSNVYEGSFYSNYKEGYALVSLPNNSNFEGLFIDDRPFGPGVFTYPNGCQDVGFWLGCKLVRLSRGVDYVIPCLASTLPAKLKLLPFRRVISLAEANDASAANILEKYGYGRLFFRSPYSKLIYNPKSIFFDKPFFDENRCVDAEKTNSNNSSLEEVMIDTVDRSKWDSVYVHHVCNSDALFLDENDFCYDEDEKRTVKEMGILTYYWKRENVDVSSENVEVFSYEKSDDFGPDEEGSVVEIRGCAGKRETNLPKILSWNRGDLCTEIIRQIYRHRAFEDKINFKITEVMSGIRTAFRKTGEKERTCLYFLKMCSLGPPRVVRDLLCDSQISPELMDNRGNNGLMFASAGDQHEIIDLLCDYGVDVNAFNDENLTPLNLCLLRRLATANDISNWEIAFLLPEEPDNVEHLDVVDFCRQETIPSLDRIFGDGMSNDDRDLNPDQVRENFEDAIEQSPNDRRLTGRQTSGESTDRSQITILNFKNFLEEDVKETSVVDASVLTGEKNPTMDVRQKKVPKSYKREDYLKSVQFSPNDRYLFDLQLKQVFPVVEQETKASAKEGKTRKSTAKIIVGEDEGNPQLTDKLTEIDDTIDKLLRRGADPNLSDFPKPSIHLGIFTQNPRTVYGLLKHGANPNHRLAVDEGLLTPLHVLVLLKPCSQLVQICQILLEFGADPECETHPEFSVREEEKDFLDIFQGRTPLYLLCMRPDIEHGDPFGHVISVGILLSRFSSKKHYYKGHSALTLAMLYGNIRLLESFLNTGSFNPNQVLQGLGTPLHFLTSTFLQKRTTYENSIKMIDFLLDAGADPLLNVTMSSLKWGNCVDYGYSEIEAEKALRKTAQKGKAPIKPDKGDHLKDHVRVLEYLFKKQQEKLNGRPIAGDDASKRVSKSSNLRQSSKKSEYSEVRELEESKRVEIMEGEITIEKTKSHRTTAEVAAAQDHDKVLIKEESLKGKEKKADVKTAKKSKGERKPPEIPRTTLTEVSGDNVTTATAESIKRFEPFSQFLLRSLLELFGNCADFDLNQFALPYVVLRNGNFYYKFHGSKLSRKEQYSLV